MTDIKGTPGGESGQTNVRYHDEGDGTYSQAVAAHLRGWDGTDGAWYRLPVDHTTGALQVSTVGGGASSTISNPSFYVTNSSVQVTQGTSPWLVSVGSHPVTISGTPTVSGSLVAGITNGTTIADTVAGDSGQNMLLAGAARKEVTASIATNTAIVTTDVSNYVWVSVQVLNAGGGLLTFQQSNDNSTWLSKVLLQANSASTNTPVSTTTGAGIWAGPLNTRWFRILPSGLSGTASVVVEFFTAPRVMDTMAVQQSSPPWSVSQSGNWQFTLASFGGVSVVPTVKGTQGTNLLPVQDAKDSGRTQVTLYIDQATGTTTETSGSFSQTKAQASVAVSQVYVVTSGKTLRIQNASAAVKATVAAITNSRWRVRVGNAINAPAVIMLEAANPTATIGSTGTDEVDLPDGLEISGGSSLVISHVESTTSSATASICLVGFEY